MLKILFILTMLILISGCNKIDPSKIKCFEENNYNVCTTLCENGNALACQKLCFETKEKKLCEKACKKGKIAACRRLKKLKHVVKKKKDPIKPDIQIERFEALSLICEKGDQIACINVAHTLIQSTQGEHIKKALKYYFDACKAKKLEACLSLAPYLLDGKYLDINKGKALEYYKLACDKKMVEGCYRLGIAYNEGDMVKKDNIISMQYLRKACNRNFKDSCFYLGIQIIKTKKKVHRGIYYLKNACTGGECRACYILGEYYEKYSRKKRGYYFYLYDNKSYRYYEQACFLKMKQGCAKYNEKKFSKRSFKKLVKYNVSKQKVLIMEKQCQKGNASKCLLVGEYYGKGIGVKKNLLKAKNYFHKACIKKITRACHHLFYFNKRYKTK
jgi:uncharacterized protein